MDQNSDERIQELYGKALQCHRAGNLNEAEQLYRKVLDLDSEHADSLHLLGVLACQCGDNSLSVDLIGRAISIESGKASYHSNLGNALKAQGKWQEAVACFERTCCLAPGIPETYYNLGSTIREQGQLERAVTSFRRALALQPYYPAALTNLGVARREQRHLAESVVICCRVLVLDPCFPEALCNLGLALREEGRLDEAISCFRRNIVLTTDLAATYFSLGLTLQTQGHWDEASVYFRKALEIKPDSAEVHYALGAVLQDQGFLDEAVSCYRRAISHNPDYPEAQNNLAYALHDQGHLDEAIYCFRRTLGLKPDYAEAHGNLGLALNERGRLDESIPCFRRDITLKPDDAEGHFVLGVTLLLAGKYAEGWAECEWRWLRKSVPVEMRRRFREPLWCGERPEGRTILLWAEQGFGDTIQFARYVVTVVQSGWRVILEAPKAIRTLLKSLPMMEEVTLLASGDPIPPFDVQCPLMSLPWAFGTRIESIPAPIPYLVAESERFSAWRARLGDSGFRIGITWQGNPTAEVEKGRSVPLACMAALCKLDGVRLISLQKHHGLDQLEQLPDGMSVETLGTDFDDGPDAFLDAAAVLMHLDLVITVDTAIGHLAGALGRPVWLALQAVPHWVWMMAREDSPWYPETRLFRKGLQEEWEQVFERMAEALRHRTLS